MTTIGRSTTVLGMTPTDFNFTGLYRHSKSNLDLAAYRAYDPDLGRWLSRDQLRSAELKQGPNLFAYVADDPVNRIDREGKSWTHWLEDIWRMWEGSQCAKIIAKWKADCFDKIPKCKCEDSGSASTYERNQALEKYVECVGQAQDKEKECLKGMNKELTEEGCATVSL
jgi:RHS repeat-associated protein